MMLWLPATFAWAAKEFWTPCFKMTVAGAIGSSDVTIADFLVALLHDRSLEECPRLAVAVGACNVEAVDVLNGIRTWDATPRDWRRDGNGNPSTWTARIGISMKAASCGADQLRNKEGKRDKPYDWVKEFLRGMARLACSMDAAEEYEKFNS